jgi:hypothetical protein
MDDQETTETTEKLLAALRHPIRRRILTKVLELDRPMSPRGLANELDMPLSNVSYHARVLVARDLFRLVDLQPVRGSIQHFYEATDLVEHPLAKATLRLSDGGAKDACSDPAEIDPASSEGGEADECQG